MKVYRLVCEILSPLHIGTGDELDPLDYIIRDDKFQRISFERIIGRMSDAERTAFESIIDSGDLRKLRAYVHTHPDTLTANLFSIAVSPAVKCLYDDKINDIQNQLLIHPFVRTAGETTPIIPGSSFKGAIRTAVINELAKTGNVPKPRETREEYEFEARVLGSSDAKNDPFRGMKIRDAALVNDDMIIREVKNLKRGNNGVTVTSIQMMCEVTHSRVSGMGVSFKTELLVDDALQSVKYLSQNLSIAQVIGSCNNFYRDKLEMEHRKFFKNSQFERWSKAVLDVPVGESEFLLRVGRFSGVESVTFDNYRNPKPPGKKAKWGTSRNIAEGMYPMGWIKVKVEETGT